ncbi:MAG: chemotaxis protein CheX [Candidatus Gastranaerophilales bacterium]|nr:chemotaxis protein CheX [Candidatus Gastranaerophilales bacterium]
MENTTEVLESKFDTLFGLAKRSFEEIMLEVTGEAIQADGEFSIQPENRLSLSIIIGISGNTNGRILLNTSVDYGKNIAVAMNFGDPLENEEDLHVYLAEFANMFCGRAATHINNAFGKREIWISPPAIFSAKDLDIVTPNVSSMKAYYECSLGKFIVDMGFSENTYDEF